MKARTRERLKTVAAVFVCILVSFPLIIKFLSGDYAVVVRWVIAFVLTAFVMTVLAWDVRRRF